MCDGTPLWTTGGQCPAKVSSLDCNSAVSSGILSYNITSSGVNFSIPYTGGNGGVYTSQTFLSSGVLGLTANLTGSSIANGSGTLNFSISGTPTSFGTAYFSITIGGKTCTISIFVNQFPPPPIIDGYTYQTVNIGNQVWFAENLRTTKYANGDAIPNVTDGNQWSNLTTGAWVHFNNNSQYENPYGKLYNWYTVADPRNVCPVGWHVPSDAEWTVLTDYLGGVYVAGGKMKSTGNQYWNGTNTAATNESGFSGLPGGNRNYTGPFFDVGMYGYWWSSTEDNTSWGGLNAWFRTLSYTDGGVNRYDNNKHFGFSVRCLRD
jgi:uncharacterized protein (TIGR02145 family)